MKWRVKAQDRYTHEVTEQTVRNKAIALEIATALVLAGYEFVVIWPDTERGWRKHIRIEGEGS